MARRSREWGISTKPEAGALLMEGAGEAGVADGAPEIAASTSRRRMRPLGPVPAIPVSAIPASFASRRAIGLTKSRPVGTAASDVTSAVGASASTVETGAGSLAGEDGTGAAGGAAFVLLSEFESTPRLARTASTSPTSSPGAAIKAMGSPMVTSCPSVAIRCTRVPSASASTSTTALSVSMIAMTSPVEKDARTPVGHWDKTALEAPAATSGMRRSSAMGHLQHLAESVGDFFILGNGRALEHLADARGCLASGHALNGLIQPVEEVPLNLVG